MLLVQPINGTSVPPSSSCSGGGKKTRPDKLDLEPVAGPSTRLSGLMKRIQAKASNCQTQFESFVNNVSSAVHKKSTSPTHSKQHGVLIGPLLSLPSDNLSSVNPALLHPNKRFSFAATGLNQDHDESPDKMKHTYLIKTATLTPYTAHSAQRRINHPFQPFPIQSVPNNGTVSPRTWNNPPNKTRPDLSSLGFRPDKHVTCIEVTLVNNNPRKNSNSSTTEPNTPESSASTSSKTHPLSGMRTYCFGETPDAGIGLGDKSPSGTMSSRSSSRGSEQFDSGFEEILTQQQKHQQRKKADSESQVGVPSTSNTASSVMRSIWDRLGEKRNNRSPKSARVVQPKRSTIRREKAFRQRNKYAWSRAKELQQKNDELLERFHQIRKRLGEEDDELGESAPAVLPCGLNSSSIPSDVADVNSSTDSLILLSPPSIVQTLVRQYDKGGGGGHSSLSSSHPRSRVKIVPSRLHSKRSSSGLTGPIRPPRFNDLAEQVKHPFLDMSNTFFPIL